MNKKLTAGLLLVALLAGCGQKENCLWIKICFRAFTWTLFTMCLLYDWIEVKKRNALEYER